MKAYKGFNKDMTCRGFQFEEGKEYTEDKAELCKSGFHACEMPLDCLNYYAPADSVYHEVELEDVDEKKGNGDTKICGKKIRIGAKIGFKGLIKASVGLVFERIKATTGRFSHAATTGRFSHAATTGEDSHAATTGRGSHAATTGRFSHAATTGRGSHAATTGEDSHAATTGEDSHAATTGRFSHAATTGVGSSSEVKGDCAIAAALGIDSKARGALGCWIVVAEWELKGIPVLIGVKAGKIDGETLKPDTWYKLENGEFVEVSDE